MLDKKRMKKAAYIGERRTVDIKGLEKESEWLKTIKLPIKCETSYYNFHKKNKTEFYSSLAVPYKVERESEKWIEYLEEVVSFFPSYCMEELENGLPDEMRKHPFLKFSGFFVAYIENKCKIANSIIRDSLKKKTIEIVLKNSTKVLLEQLYKFKGNNEGMDSSLCYEEFIKKIITLVWIEEFIYEYPLLFRVIIEESIKAMNYFQEVDVNLKNDFDKLKSKFNIKGELISLESNAGDSHKGQKQVIILKFEKGKVLYKPRNLGIDQSFERLLLYINNKIETKLYAAKVINCGNYGWQEYIPYIECKDEKDVKEYYTNLGIYSCLLNVLLASDMHMENIIASGSVPVFIDLESLFQGYKGITYNSGGIYEKIAEDIKNSVLSTSLFPGLTNMRNSRDVSGITGDGNQKVPNALYTFENLYTADMKIVRKDYIMQSKNNIPKVNGKKVFPRKYINEILNGFCIMYKFISENKEDFTKKGGILEWFYNMPVRTILRDTASYGVLLKASTEPHYMQDAAIREQLFDRLWYMVSEMENFIGIVPYEIYDLLNGDVPYFSSFINKRELYDGKNSEVCIYYEKTIVEQVAEKIKNMDAIDEEKQKDFIKKSMAEPIKRWELKEKKINYNKNLNEFKEITDGELIEKALDIAFIIEKMSYRDVDNMDIGWININITSSGQWGFMPMDNTLYEGTLGIAIFMAQLFHITKNDRVKKILDHIINSSRIFNKCYRNGNDISAFNGNLSVAYCYYYIACITKQDDLKKEAINEIIKCFALIEKDSKYDIISGCAGAMIVALRIYEKEKLSELLEFSIKCGDHLVNNISEKNEKFGWYTAAGGDSVLAGMSHGNAGISWALLELHKQTGRDKYLECAQKAINYENSLYNVEDNNWTDMRNRENRIKKGFPEPVNWCHGAPGIGLSRILCKKINSGVIDDIDIRNAIQKTLTAGFGGSDCLCHGSLGNVEILLNAANLYRNPQYLTESRKILKDLIVQNNEQGWICGVPQKIFVAGFMTGLSGIGYGLLRMLDSKNVPCVLAFELPEVK